MTVVLFLIILAVLILVHEFGHFIIAKKSGIRVDEFGLGFPPKAVGWRPEGGETEYTLNWIPFGGFVRIFGEDYTEEDAHDSERSFINKPKWIQAAVLSGGVLFNVIFAWILFSIGFMSGMPTAIQDAATDTVKDPRVMVTQVVEDGPAAEAGVMAGDVLVGLENDETISEQDLSIERIQDFIDAHAEEAVVVHIRRGDQRQEISLTPESGVLGDSPAIGIAMSRVGTLQLPPHKALWHGLLFTAERTRDVAVGITQFLYRAVTGTADYGQVAGPVGIASLVGEATALGFVHLLSFTAFISLNLAVLNLIPFPALDGGRLLFVLIEKIKGSPIKPKVANILNTIGFALLILLMIVITYNDILRIF